MATLYSNNDIRVTNNVIEVQGERFSPLHYNMVYSSPISSGVKECLVGIGIFGLGCYFSGIFVHAFFVSLFPFIRLIHPSAGKCKPTFKSPSKHQETGKLEWRRFHLKNREKDHNLRKALKESFDTYSKTFSLAKLEELVD